MTRADGRKPDALRPVRLTLGFMPYAEGSALIELGATRVVCTVSVEESVPPFLRGRGIGWLTAEYRMLPRSTRVRTPRETAGRLDGRSAEIQRLIGRSLRAAVDRATLGERTLLVDCDVLGADGGTRTAAITGSFVALALACDRLLESGLLQQSPLVRQVAAISAGRVEGEDLLDLTYAEDSIADVDCNVVLTDYDETVEFQLSAERSLPRSAGVERLFHLARGGVGRLLAAQRDALERERPGWFDRVRRMDTRAQRA